MLTSLLFYKGLNYADFEPILSEEEMLDIYDKKSHLYYIVWDKIDELKF